MTVRDSIVYPGWIGAKINTCWELSKKIELANRINPHPPKIKEVCSTFKGATYMDEWKFLLENRCYNIVFSDSSFLYFLYSNRKGCDEYSYYYYECPSAPPTLEEYIKENYGPDFIELADEIHIEYEQYVLDYPTKKGITPVRYDYELRLYKPGRHPVSHMHIGYNNNIRIFIENVLNPVSFLAFILRQYYPDIWEKKVIAKHVSLLGRNIRDGLEPIDQNYNDELFEYEMKLS